MALLRTQGGGLLATGPEAVRANFLRQQDALLKGAAAPSVIRAPQQVITEENPFNIGQGLASLGKSLGQMAVMDRERQARAAAQAAGNNPAALMAVQRQFPNTAAGKTAGTLAARLTGDKLRRDRLAFEKERAETDFTLRREGAAATAAQRATENKLAQARDARQAAEAARQAADFKAVAEGKAKEEELRRRAGELINRGDLEGAYGQLVRSNDPTTRQAAINALRNVQKDKNPKAILGGNTALIKEYLNDDASIKDIAGLDADLNSIVQDLDDGKLEFGARRRLASFVGNNTGYFLGEDDEQKVRAANKFERFIQRYVNQSLRLARGVQTDSDARRVINELKFAQTPDDVRVVLLQLQEQNRRNREKYIGRINSLFRAYGERSPYDRASPAPTGGGSGNVAYTEVR